jgi:hypothetical protein
MTPLSLQERVRQANFCLIRTLDCWISIDVGQVEQCQHLLKHALLELQEINDSLCRMGGCRSAELHASLIQLKLDAARIARVIDSGLALLQGLEVRLGRRSAGYAASGRPVAEMLAPTLDAMRA